jgi:hypothetical protein
MKAPRCRADGESGYGNNVYYIAASCRELDPKKVSVSVRVGLWLNKNYDTD